MPQTISLQRGSVTYTANGSSTSNITTLFTNSSSGIATRVIINYLTINNPFVAPGSPMESRSFQTRGFLGVVNGSAAAMIGYMSGASGSPSTTNGMMSCCMPIADSSAPYGNTVNQGINFINTAADSNQIGFQNQNPNNIQFNVGGNAGGYCPRTFWIGPSDSIRWWPQASLWTQRSGKSLVANFVTQTMYYSFTLITES